eukprot:365758-Rhodomonas_salina.1
MHSAPGPVHSALLAHGVGLSALQTLSAVQREQARVKPEGQAQPWTGGHLAALKQRQEPEARDN